MLLGEDFFEFLKGKLKGVDFFLQDFEELEGVSAFPELDDFFVEKFLFLFFLFFLFFSQKLFIRRSFAVGFIHEFVAVH